MRNKAIDTVLAAVIVLQGVGTLNADPVTTIVPSAYLSYSFAGQKLPSTLHYGAQLSLDHRFDEPRRLGAFALTDAATAPADQPLSVPYAQLDVDQGHAVTMKLLGSDVAGYRYRLSETETASEAPGWFSRNWGWVALAGGLVAGGIVAVVSGSSHSSNDANSGENNCTPNGPVTVGQCGNGVAVTR